ncbi:MAG: DUF924 domain-containing protein [Cereibacter sphaeroides]|uniref:DUF924 domain-containing protein n=1 Tax=Cereibacter sphaeroides TaxID=1063 RepID=A0A2W5SBH6_CERSP|nr:MAG: DUF924 domain-containing protein [Cereibacter sphaeroides]
MSDPVEVLDFWLGDLGPEGWYAGGDTVDAECRSRFTDLCEAARAGGLEHWVDGTVGTLAYLIVTDQLPRNIYRGNALAFATDPQARAAARRAVDAGWDMNAPEPERQFFYMPFEHSEELADQDFGIALMRERLPETWAENGLHAQAHHDIIARHGRFPFRNAALGRENTPEEAEFLAQGSYPAFVKRLEQQAMQQGQGAAALTALPGGKK